MRTLALVTGLIAMFLLGAVTHNLYQRSELTTLKLEIEELTAKSKKQTVVEKLVVDHNAVQCLNVD